MGSLFHANQVAKKNCEALIRALRNEPAEKVAAVLEEYLAHDEGSYFLLAERFPEQEEPGGLPGGRSGDCRGRSSVRCGEVVRFPSCRSDSPAGDGGFAGVEAGRGSGRRTARAALRRVAARMQPDGSPDGLRRDLTTVRSGGIVYAASSGRGAIPHRRYSPRPSAKRKPNRWNSGADSKVWMREDRRSGAAAPQSCRSAPGESFAGGFLSIGPSCPEQVTTGEREMGFDPIEEVIAGLRPRRNRRHHR